jgi:hypothetical protein
MSVSYRSRPWGLQDEGSSMRPRARPASGQSGLRGRLPDPGFDQPSEPYGRVQAEMPGGPRVSYEGDAVGLAAVVLLVLAMRSR